MNKSVSLIILLCFSFNLAIGQSALLHQPALNHNGSKIAFSHQGDIWVVNAMGGIATRLTIHEAYETSPSWSFDDKHLAFTSNRYGNRDIFTINPKGQGLVRKTFHSASDNTPAWAPDNGLFFTSNRNFRAVERALEIHHLSNDSATPYRYMDALGFSPVVSPNGRYIAFVRGACRVAREAYTGPANKDIWLFDTQTKGYTQVTRHEGQDHLPKWKNNSELYFLSARNGRYNVYSINISNQNNAKPKRITNVKDEGIRHFDLSTDGKKLVYEYKWNLWLQDTDSGKAKALEIEVSSDYRFDPVESKTFSSKATEFRRSPNGKRIAFIVHGDLFIKINDKDKKRTVQLTQTAAREKNVQWLSDSTLLFLSDRGGNFDIYKMESDDSDEKDLFKTLKHKVSLFLQTDADESQLTLAPDKDKMIYVQGRGKLQIADIDTLGNFVEQKTLLDGWSIPRGLVWSPDGQWIAYSMDDLNFNEEVYILKADNSQKPVNISMHPRLDQDPVWSADGKKLGFLSIRNNGDADVWFVWLKKDDWEKSKRDWDELDEEEDSKAKKDTAKLVVEIDLENIYERLVQVTRMAGNEENLSISKDGKTFYFTTNGGSWTPPPGKPSFYSVSWDGKALKELFPDLPIRQSEWDKKHASLYVLNRKGSIVNINPSKKKQEAQSFSAKMKIDHQAERNQVFEEAWRSLRDGFYDPQFHGQDWKKLKKHYKAYAINASTSQDFRYFTNLMLGQLNASHMGVYGSGPEETQKQVTGRLGIEFKMEAGGARVTRVIPNTAATRTDHELQVGDLIKSVNGNSLGLKENAYQHLEGSADEKVLLSVQSSTGDKEIVVRPRRSVNTELYEAWVKERKALTDQYSNGKLGYIHIRGMNWSSFERFERELMASGQGKEGIVIDVRFNGGGWTTDMLMAVLNVRQHAYTIPRDAAKNLNKQHKSFKQYYPYGERLPLSAMTLPSVALCNEASYSNAEIFSHAFKHLGHGKLVGKPTFGAVISTGGKGLMDGSYVRMPYRAWYVKATEENMENGPAVPDYIIDNAPDYRAKNNDAQLKKAVEVLLEEIEG